MGSLLRERVELARPSICAGAARSADPDAGPGHARDRNTDRVTSEPPAYREQSFARDREHHALATRVTAVCDR
jgi:hypothetical protein